MEGKGQRKTKRRRKTDAEFAEGAEFAEKSQEKRRNVVAFDRKNPPFAKGAKDGAPSSSFLRWHWTTNPRGPGEPGPYKESGVWGLLGCGDAEGFHFAVEVGALQA